jgi:hypothetical protein
VSLGIATLAGAVVAACGLGPPATPAPTPSPVASTAATAAASPTAPSGGPKVLVDPSLLEILPDSVDGVAIAPEAETAAQLATDASLQPSIEALAMGLAVDATAEAEDLAIITVVRVRPGLLNDAFFRSYRESYDEAACAPAGGVAGNAESELDGRRVFIGSCEGGAFTYHAVHSGDVIVSVTSLGERRLGEKVMSDLEG